MRRIPAHMRRNRDILRSPQRVPLRQRLRVRDIERGAAKPPVVHGINQVVGADDGSASDIRHIRLRSLLLALALALAAAGTGVVQDLELRRAQQAFRLRRERQGHDEEIQSRRQERVDVLRVRAREPLRGQDALRVAEPRYVVRVVVARLRGRSGPRRVRVDFGPEGCRGPGHLAADAAVA